MLNYAVIHEDDDGTLEAFGPFKAVSDAKSWMAQTFNHNCEVAKKSNIELKWTWSDEKLGFCSLAGFGNWKVVPLTK